MDHIETKKTQNVFVNIDFFRDFYWLLKTKDTVEQQRWATNVIDIVGRVNTNEMAEEKNDTTNTHQRHSDNTARQSGSIGSRVAAQSHHLDTVACPVDQGIVACPAAPCPTKSTHMWVTMWCQLCVRVRTGWPPYSAPYVIANVLPKPNDGSGAWNESPSA